MSTTPYHAIVSAYFGDDEYDIGKSAAWTDMYCADTFILDVNVNVDGTTRYFVVDWGRSYPNAKTSTLTGVPFFSPANAALWRKTAFQRAYAAWNYPDSDFVLFVDGTEGISVDDSVAIMAQVYAESPEDPFRWFVDQAVARAAGDVVYLPFYVFLRYDNVREQSYIFTDEGNQAVTELADVQQQLADEQAKPPASQDAALIAQLQQQEQNLQALIAMSTSIYPMSSKYYINTGFLPRLVRVSALRDPAFDWSSLDVVVATNPGADPSPAFSLTSYAYAHYHEDPSLGFTEANDVGFGMRQLISKVRAVPGLKIDAWEAPNGSGIFPSDPLGTLIPNVPPDTRPDQDGWTDLYDCVFRDNPRDGLWYIKGSGGIGPVPWDYLTNDWAVPPDVWYGQPASTAPYVQPIP